MREKPITYKGVTKNQSEWADFFGVTRGAISLRIHELGGTPEQAIESFATRPRKAGRKWAKEQTDGMSPLSSLELLSEILAEIRGIRADRKEAQDGK